MPEQVALEFDVANGNNAHLQRAIASYQSRGYGIAIGDFGRHDVDLKIVEAIRPAIVSLDPLLVGSPRPLEQLIDQLHALGAQVMSEGAHGLARCGEAPSGGVDLLLLPAPSHRLLPASGAFSAAPAPVSKAA